MNSNLYMDPNAFVQLKSIKDTTQKVVAWESDEMVMFCF